MPRRVTEGTGLSLDAAQDPNHTLCTELEPCLAQLRGVVIQHYPPTWTSSSLANPLFAGSEKCVGRVAPIFLMGDRETSPEAHAR